MHPSTKTATPTTTRLPSINSGTRLAIVGIGSELRSDDAAGVLIARRLASRLPPRSNVLILDAGAVPESFTGPLRRFQPSMVLLVDSANLGLEPGQTGLLEWHESGGLSAGTHTLPVAVVAQYLHNEIGCQVFLLGIQPASLDFLGGLTPAVRKAVDGVVNSVMKWLKGAEAPAKVRRPPIV